MDALAKAKEKINTNNLNNSNMNNSITTSKYHINSG